MSAPHLPAAPSALTALRVLACFHACCLQMAPVDLPHGPLLATLCSPLTVYTTPPPSPSLSITTTRMDTRPVMSRSVGGACWGLVGMVVGFWVMDQVGKVRKGEFWTQWSGTDDAAEDD